MSNINDWAFANKLELFKNKVLDPQNKRVEEAKKIMDDPNYQWKDAEQKKIGQAKYEVIAQWLKFYQDFYEEGRKLVQQHEGLVDKVSQWYYKWYENVSNEGRQDVEMMSMQADILQSIFVEMYEQLKPLNLDVKQPKALNL